MQIDLFTYGAQLINFALLIFLLRRFLYKPITAAMADREAKIAARFQEVEKQRAQAHQEAELFHEKRAEFETDRAALLAEVHREAAEQREAMMLAARAEVDEVQQGWIAAIEQEQQTMQQALRAQTVQQIMQMSSHLLTELADVTLEEKLITRFIARLQALESKDLAKLKASVLEAHRVVVICSAFPISPDRRHQLDEALNQVLSDDVELASAIRTRYTLCPALIAGIELRLHDYHLTWNVRDELKTLDAELDDIFRSHA